MGGEGREVGLGFWGRGELKTLLGFRRKNGRSKSLLVISICLRKLDNHPFVFFGFGT